MRRAIEAQRRMRGLSVRGQSYLRSVPFLINAPLLLHDGEQIVSSINVIGVEPVKDSDVAVLLFAKIPNLPPRRRPVPGF